MLFICVSAIYAWSNVDAASAGIVLNLTVQSCWEGLG